jgi:hypothetical protein
MCINDSVIGSHPIEKQSSGIVAAENNSAPRKGYQMMASVSYLYKLSKKKGVDSLSDLYKRGPESGVRGCVDMNSLDA